MALWKDTNTTSTSTPPASAAGSTSASGGMARDPYAIQPDKSNVAPLTPDAARRPRDRAEMRESVIASDLTIEGKIVGSGHIRIAGRFKGDVHVDGNLAIDSGAHLEGQVRAAVVTVAGELRGNIENAKKVELLEGGIISGDVKAGSLTVAAGSRMRGQVEFGWEEEGKKAHLETKGVSSAS